MRKLSCSPLKKCCANYTHFQTCAINIADNLSFVYLSLTQNPILTFSITFDQLDLFSIGKRAKSHTCTMNPVMEAFIGLSAVAGKSQRGNKSEAAACMAVFLEWSEGPDTSCWWVLKQWWSRVIIVIHMRWLMACWLFMGLEELGSSCSPYVKTSRHDLSAFYLHWIGALIALVSQLLWCRYWIRGTFGHFISIKWVKHTELVVEKMPMLRPEA